MRVGSFAVARPNYYDRSATTKSTEYAGTTGPHAVTQRYTFTVASGYKAYVESCVTLATVATVATTRTAVYASQYVVTDDSGAADLAIVKIYGNTLGQQLLNVVSGVSLLNAGNQLVASTSDTSTGGTIDYILSVKYTQFAA